MTVSEFFGCSFIAFGPALAMFVFTIAKDPIRVIILIASAFFWLLSLLISAAIWMCIPISQHLVVGLVVSVIMQELFRFAVYKIIRYFEYNLELITENGRELVENKHILAYTAGLGFGLISGLFASINVLADAVGPATTGLLGGPSNFFMTSASFSMLFIFLHVFWSVIFFAALDDKNYWRLCWVIASHYLASIFTLFNRNELYVASFLPVISLVILNGIFAYIAAGGTEKSFRQCVRSWQRGQ